MKKLFALIGIMILVIPTVLSGYFYHKALEEEKARERLFSVIVISPDGKEYIYSVPSDGDRSDGESDIVRCFHGRRDSHDVCR